MTPNLIWGLEEAQGERSRGEKLTAISSLLPHVPLLPHLAFYATTRLLSTCLNSVLPTFDSIAVPLKNSGLAWV